MIRVCICGGGSLGTVCAGVLGANEEVKVSLLTGRPAEWKSRVTVTDFSGKVYTSDIVKITSNPEEVIPDSDIVLLCQPGYMIERTLRDVSPYLKSDTVVGSIVSSTGFFFKAHDILPVSARLFGFQRVPFIARVTEYGCSAALLGYKDRLAVALENIPDKESFRVLLERLFMTTVCLMNNFYEVSLTNSNPILHTGRLYSLWHTWDGTPYDHCLLFYAEWNDESSQYLIDMDKEFMEVLRHLPVSEGAIPSLLEYYESSNASSMTKKISSIPAFRNIYAPMKETLQGWVPDFGSRYFIEDFPFGLKYIKDLASQYNLETPNIDRCLKWGLKVMKK